MCFVLYAGTTHPIPRRAFRKETPDLSIEDIGEDDAPIRAHFYLPHVQYVGSTSCCGCDFPNLMYQNGGWPVWPPVEENPEALASDRYNRQLLSDLLASTGEPEVELYGEWSGEFLAQPRIREEIRLASILRNEFYFKQGGFYRVKI